MATKYIGGDVHVATTDLAVDHGGEIVRRDVVPTTVPAIREVLLAVRRPRVLAIEEGALAGWLYRNLRGDVDEMIVSDPRRNRYIAADGDKDDPIDAGKLAALARGGYLRAVYHTDNEDRIVLKQWVQLYHDRVRATVREMNKIYARARAYGLGVPGDAVDSDLRAEWLESLRIPALAEQLRLLFRGYDSAVDQADRALREMTRRSRAYPIIRYWRDLPGIGPIRSVTMFAYLDTPWRFPRPNKLWKYCGLGLERRGSGRDSQGRKKKEKLRLAWSVNRCLKGAVQGAAISAIGGENVFADQYRRLLRDGVSPGNARHTVARTMLTVLWGMWKANERFDPDRLALAS